MSLTDEQLLERVAQSYSGSNSGADPEAATEAFKMLFEKYQPVLFRYLMFRVDDEDLAHDLIQETFLRVWQRRANLDPRLSFAAYLFRVGGNLLKDYFKHEAVRSRFVERERSIAGEGDRPDMEAEAHFLQTQIEKIVNQEMPRRCREVFILSRVEGKSNREIAEMLHLKTKSVENQVTKALDILRRRLKKRAY